MTRAATGFWLLVLLGWAAISPCAPVEKVTFTFNPPAGTSFDEKTDARSATTMGNESKSGTESILVHTRTEKDAKEYRYIATIASMQDVSEQKSFKPFDGAAEGLVLTYHITPKGQMTKVGGYEKLSAALAKKLPADKVKDAAKMRKQFEDAQGFQEMMGWTERVGQFSGRTVTVGKTTIDGAVLTLPNGLPVKVYRATVIAGWTTIQGHKVLRVITHSNPNAYALASTVNMSAKAIRSALKKPLPTPKGTTLTRRFEVDIDPTTMLVYAEITDYHFTSSLVDAKTKAKTPISVTSHREVKMTYK